MQQEDPRLEQGMAAEKPPVRMRIIALLALAAATAVIFGGTVNHGFLSIDDPRYVGANPHTSAGFTWAGIWWAFTAFHDANWFPLTWLSHMADFEAYGNWPGGHHLTSIVLHVLNALLLLRLLDRMTGAFWQSAFAAALFALHPLRVESVAWIAERKDVLSVFLFLLTLLSYARYAELPSRVRYTATLSLYALGLMAKPMLVTLPFVLLLLDWWPLERYRPAWRDDPAIPAATRTLTELVAEKIPFFLLSLASSVITIAAQQAGGAVVPPDIMPIAERFARAGIHYSWYLWKMVWPVDLAFFYPVGASPAGIDAAAAAALIMALSLLVLRAARTAPHLVTGWFWFLGTLVPVIGIVAVGMQGTADRYTYIPSIGICVAIAWLVPSPAARSARQRAVLAAGAVVVLLLLSVLTWRQVGYWKDSRTLSEHAVSVTRDNYVALTILGTELDDEGRSSEAIARFREAVRIQAMYEPARNGMGVAFCRQGLYEAAMTEFKTVVQLNPSLGDAYVNMGVCAAGHGRLREAAEYFREAVRIDPDHIAAPEYLERALHDLARERAPGK